MRQRGRVGKWKPTADMNWKLISAVQRTCAALPVGSESLYWAIQRTVGGRKNGIDLIPYFEIAAKMVARLNQANSTIEDARVMEVGTGHALALPICLYLCGARAVYTFDLHRYLKPKLVMESLGSIRGKSDLIRDLFSPHMDRAKLDSRLATLFAASTFEELIELTKIDYRAPADATATGLPDHSVDIHFSNNVLEHVPGPVIQRMLIEANRVLSHGGLAYHRINPGDHFARYDRSISSTNFLRFSDSEWQRVGGNKFGYHNRLRAYEYKEIFRLAGHEIIWWDDESDARALEELKSGFPLHPAYEKCPPDQLAIVNFEVLSRPETMTISAAQPDSSQYRNTI